MIFGQFEGFFKVFAKNYIFTVLKIVILLFQEKPALTNGHNCDENKNKIEEEDISDEAKKLVETLTETESCKNGLQDKTNFLLT